MTERDDDPVIPDDARWTHLSNDLLASSEAEELRDMAESFEPVPYEAGFEMARWLCDGVAQGVMPEETHLIHTDDELLGFFAVRRALVKISFKAWPLFELRRRIENRDPQLGLMLVSIVRSCTTDAGFGQALFDHALGLAFEDRNIVAIFVQPDNDGVSRMWQESYKFRRMEDREMPGLLYYPVDKAPEALWP
jgi:ribosomal protein S18 acetylase RimI-like enzyme